MFKNLFNDLFQLTLFLYHYNIIFYGNLCFIIYIFHVSLLDMLINKKYIQYL